MLRFETGVVIRWVDMVDSMGRMLQKISVSENEKTVNISTLSTGIYFAIFHTAERKKIVKTDL